MTRYYKGVGEIPLSFALELGVCLVVVIIIIVFGWGFFSL